MMDRQLGSLCIQVAIARVASKVSQPLFRVTQQHELPVATMVDPKTAR